MDRLIQEFPEQLLEAIAIGQQAKLTPHSQPLHNIFVSGLGGSGIGANFVQSFIDQECNVPFTVNKGYHIPKSVGANTLAIFSSYSGNTEETLSALQQAIPTGAKIVCVASGGKLLELAKTHHFDYIALPAGKPSPRACLGYSLVQQLFIFQHFGFIGDSYLRAIRSSVELLNSELSDIQARAQMIAQFLYQKIAIIYTEDRMEPVAVRLRQQLNENAKVLCWHHVIPEMNHNELVGWTQPNENLAVLILRNADDYNRNQIRTNINKDIIRKYASVVELYSKGNNQVERAMYLVHLGDWISWYLAVLNGCDAVEVNVINFLKGELSKY